MKKFYVIMLALTMMISLAACGGKTEPDTSVSAEEPQTSETQIAEPEASDLEASSDDTENTTFPEGDPAEYSREFWEEKYPGENICPFYINENGVERSYYWISGFEGWDGTMASWIEQPFNWNGWHKTADGCILNSDETLKLTDAWANGDECMSSFCTVETEKYAKNVSAEQNSESNAD